MADVETAKERLPICGVAAMISKIAATLSQHGGLRLSGSSVLVVDVTVSCTGIDADFLSVNTD